MGSRSSSGDATGKRAVSTPARTKAKPKTETQAKPTTKAEVQAKSSTRAAPQPRARAKAAPEPARTPGLSTQGLSEAGAKSPAVHSKASAQIASETPTKKRTASRAVKILPEERYRLVREEAYYIAERRGFRGGSAEDDWAAAEKEVDRMLKAMAKTAN